MAANRTDFLGRVERRDCFRWLSALATTSGYDNQRFSPRWDKLAIVFREQQNVPSIRPYFRGLTGNYELHHGQLATRV